MTTYRIGDLVKVDERASFRNDVQLDNFDDPTLNLGLINSYLFSTALPGGGRSLQERQDISPYMVLEKLVQVFNSNLENRFCLIANYGHGKSHLALALANYFSRPASSPEVSTLLQKITNALGDPATAARYHDFKKSKGEFLVLRLRGDLPHNLHDQLLSGLEKALNEHVATRGTKLPFWFKEAEEIINNFSPTEKEKANDYLRNQSYDIPLLLQQLGKRANVYDLCVKLIHHVKGVRPHLGREISLAEVVRWATDNFCGPGKPLGGVLILFDEFGLYIQRYAQRDSAGELQDLLNGISDRQGQTAFLAFSQLDLMQLADNLQAGAATKTNLKRELTRIPKSWTLFSLMESVISAYLIQDKNRWQSFLADRSIAGPFTNATDVAWEQFQKRYATNLLWTFSYFQERISKGTFPLHPITTYLLCNLKLRSDDASTPRTALGFVLDKLHLCENEPAVSGKRPNWILPINLVDYFGERLDQETYAQYNTAKSRIGNDAPEAQQIILKALLLQLEAGLTPRDKDQIAYLAQSAGLDELETRQALRTLSDNTVIRYDHTYKSYSFWPATTNPKLLEETIQKKVTQFAWTTSTLQGFNETLAQFPESNFGTIDTPVKWGHEKDWAARELIVTPDLLTIDWLKNITVPFGYNHTGLVEANRSLVVWVATEKAEDLNGLREKINQVIQEALAVYGPHPPVVIFIAPNKSHPELLESYRRYHILKNFSQKERTDIGQDMYDNEVKKTQLDLFKSLGQLREDSQVVGERQRSRSIYLVPNAYAATLRTREKFSIRALLQELYKAAFSYAPPEFFHQYPLKSSSKLKGAVRKSANVLLRNAPSELKTLARSDNDRVVGDLADKFLVQKWKLLMADDYRIREEPDSQQVREAWQHIDRGVKPGRDETKLRDVLFPLLNPPYGYDYNTAILLFAAWFGYHRLDLEMSINGQRTAKESFGELLTKGPKDFFQDIAITKVVTLQRKAVPDKTEIRQRIKDSAHKQFTIIEAHNEIVWLNEIISDDRHGSELRSDADEAKKSLEEGRSNALKYDHETGLLKQQIERANSPENLIDLSKRINALPTLSNVKGTQDSVPIIREKFNQRIEQVVEQICQENESPKQLTDVGLCKERLEKTRKVITLATLPNLVQRIRQSLERLEERKTQLEAAWQEDQRIAGLEAKIVGVDPAGSLFQLLAGADTLRQLDNLPKEIAEKRNNRLKQVEQAIANINQQIAQSRVALANCKQTTHIRPVRDTLLKLQTTCANTNQATEIWEILINADALEATLTAQEKQHSELKQAITNVTVRGEQPLLNDLLQGRLTLQAMANLPSDLAQLRDSQLKQVEKAIDDIQVKIGQAKQQLETAQTMAQLNLIRDSLYNLKSRCANTPEVMEIDSALANLVHKQEIVTQAQQRADDMRRVIESADPQATLKRLLAFQEQLQTIGDVPAGLNNLLTQKLEAITNAIKSIRSQISQARNNLPKATDRQALNKIRDTLLPLQTRCAELPEGEEIAQLIVQVDQRKAILDEEKGQRDQWRAIINGVNTKQQPLRVLLDGQKTLEALPALPEDLNRERNRRLQEIKNGVASLKQQVEQIEGTLNSVTDQNQLRKQRDTLFQLKQQSENTILEPTLASLIDRADKLRAFFDQLDQERISKLDSPLAYQEQINRLEQLGQAVTLSLNQRGLVAKKQEEARKVAGDQQKQAQNWLAKQKEDSQMGHLLATVAAQLQNPPQTVLAFLSPAELDQLTQLRQQVGQRIDADNLMAIEKRFRQIQDRGLQEQCLQRLHQIFEASQNG